MECSSNNCTVQPSFGMPGGKAKYCDTHKLDGMVNVKKPRCSVKGCVEVGDFTTEEDVDNKKKIKYCLYHKTSDMVNFITIKRLELKYRKMKEDGTPKKRNRKIKKNKKNTKENNKANNKKKRKRCADEESVRMEATTNWLDAEDFVSPYDDDLLDEMQLKSNKRRLLLPI
jgi:hypothetical protein